ncbi:UDP-N-acetylmuramoyl-tripeptide--D-alanyl-D-alanine ligase [Euzebya rosea]|uniref:UDP-N-acetylmuramoyl-tripeptide--D-alanyl-D- alanine ligase n=1 Tax=Euzebya rosea TaxID=2052804 RepID=UPI000D3E7063|nr:UDP-N-acetylmuramoyl-tripeptide--D-alanyl-D-alanine ligase [Euzebya rosea]
MIPLAVAAVADIVGGDLVADSDNRITGVAIDSRRVMAGDLFVPLVGEHSDGHDWIEAAVAAGATGFLCDEAHAGLAERLPGGIVVDDPLDALTGLAAWVRDEVDPIVIAVTGSNGKTTTKDLTAAAIGEARVTVANPGSFNNEIGLPLTLCLLTAETEVLVCEIGARGIGHIAEVMPMLRPDVAIVTTIGGAHIGEFGSLDAIVQAKGELVEGLSEEGVAVLNADVPEVAGLAERSPGRVVTFGNAATADLHPHDVTVDEAAHAVLTIGDVTVRLPRPGMHNVGNALAALAAAEVVGVPRDVAAAGLASAGVSRWRMEVTTNPTGVVVVNDAYNANPQSTIAAIDTLASIRTDGSRWAVLGFMAELGEETGPGHRSVGAHLAEAGIDGVVVVEGRAGAIADGAREAGFTGRILTAADVGEATDTITGLVAEGDVVLVKGSRSVGLEVLAAALLEDGGTR